MIKTILIKQIIVLLSLLILITSCASTTTISSIPSNSKLYLNGELVGATPYEHRDTKIVGSSNEIRLEQEGYDTYITTFSKDEEINVVALIGGIFFLIPFLWVMKYKKAHLYELRPKE